jgi:hypothetical protein
MRQKPIHPAIRLLDRPLRYAGSAASRNQEACSKNVITGPDATDLPRRARRAQIRRPLRQRPGSHPRQRCCAASPDRARHRIRAGPGGRADRNGGPPRPLFAIRRPPFAREAPHALRRPAAPAALAISARVCTSGPPVGSGARRPPARCGLRRSCPRGRRARSNRMKSA